MAWVAYLGWHFAHGWPIYDHIMPLIAYFWSQNAMDGLHVLLKTLCHGLPLYVRCTYQVMIAYLWWHCAMALPTFDDILPWICLLLMTSCHDGFAYFWWHHVMDLPTFDDIMPWSVWSVLKITICLLWKTKLLIDPSQPCCRFIGSETQVFRLTSFAKLFPSSIKCDMHLEVKAFTVLVEDINHMAAENMTTPVCGWQLLVNNIDPYNITHRDRIYTACLWERKNLKIYL